MKYGKAAFEAYTEVAGWRSLATGEPLPKWESISLEMQHAWDDAAAAAIAEDQRERNHWLL